MSHGSGARASRARERLLASAAALVCAVPSVVAAQEMVPYMAALGAIGEERAADARRGFAQLALIRCPHEPLSDRVWRLRHNLSAYDATFVALAELLDAPLVTCDARLASAPGHGARVELFEVARPYAG